MTGPQRLDRDLPLLLEDLYMGGTPDYRDDLVQRIERTRQRPVWMFPERWLPVDITTERAAVARVPWRAVGLVALLALIVAASLAIYIGSQRQPGPVPAPFGLARNGALAVSLDGDIVAVDQASGQVTPLVTGPEDDQEPTYSPDGTKLGFIRGTPGDIRIIVRIEFDELVVLVLEVGNRREIYR